MLDTGPGSGRRCFPSLGGELALDLPEVPPDSVDAAVDVGAGETPGLADLPDEQQRQEVAVLDQRVDRVGHPRPALVQFDAGPQRVLPTAKSTAATASSVDQRRPRNRRAVDRVDVVTGMPIRRHSPRTRLRRRSESNASGATCTQRAYVSHQDIPDLRTNGTDRLSLHCAGLRPPAGISLSRRPWLGWWWMWRIRRSRSLR
jgi:pimeloyl-ACP methyl ester carboxylesterase